MKYLFFLLSVFLLVSCSLAPFTSTKTARTLGNGNWEIDTGFSPALYFSAARGFGENFDGGMTIEGQTFPVLGLTGKYAFFNEREEGFSLSGFGGIFFGLDVVETSGYYFGPVFSYKIGWFEPYIVSRYNWLEWKGQDLSSDKRDDLFVNLLNFDNVELSYMQYTLGFNFWFSEGFALNINAKYITFFGNKVESGDETNILPGLALMWRF